MKRGGFVPIVLIIAAALVVGLGGFGYLVSKNDRPEETAGGNSQTIKESLNDTERQVEIATKSGGIRPENYKLLEQRLNDLAGQGVDPKVIAALRAKLMSLNVGEKSIKVALPPAPKQLSPKPPEIVSPSGKTDAQLLFAVEEELKIAQKTGGIGYQEYDRLEKQLADLESRKVDTSLARSELSKLIVSGRPVICKSNRKPVFTHHITDVSKIDYVAPPPTMGAGPGLKTHSYIGTNKARVPVYAPVDMVLETGAYYDIGPYWLGFRISCEMKLRFIHITDPVDQIKAVFPAMQRGTAERPNAGSVDQPIKKEIPFKAGDLIGYTETGNWDFGVYDLESQNRYLGDPKWGDSWVYTGAVCPFDYFPENMRTAYTSKFDTKILEGNPPHGESFCAKYFK